MSRMSENTALPLWLRNAPVWMIEQWRSMPIPVIQSMRALQDDMQSNRRFSWASHADVKTVRKGAADA